MENKQAITMEEFNQNYRIEVLVKAIQPANLGESCNQSQELSYDAIDEVLENIEFTVYDKATKEKVFWVEESVDAEFLAALKKKFNIVDLEINE